MVPSFRPHLAPARRLLSFSAGERRLRPRLLRYITTEATVKDNPHRSFYRTFGRPVAQTFLVALLTYQFVYWAWLQLETIEVKHDTKNEIQSLEAQVARRLAATKA